MPFEVIMPKVDMDMESGRILVSHVEEGCRVEKSDPLFEIETSKAAMEVGSPEAGVVGHIPAPAGTVAGIGRTVAWIYAEGEAIGLPPVSAKRGTLREPGPGTGTHAGPNGGQAAGDAAGQVGPRATPAAKRLAKKRALRLQDIAGTGPRGRVQQIGVERAIEARGTAGTTEEALHRDRDGSATELEARAPGQAGQSNKLSIPRSGDGKGVPFVFLHGLASDASSWASIESLLQTDQPVVWIEMPCHGRSPLLRVDSWSCLAQRMCCAFDSLELEAAHLVGHSLGGAIALAITDIRPRAVLSLTLLCPAGLGPEHNAAAIRGIATADTSERIEPWLARRVADANRIDGSHVRAAAASRADAALRAAQLPFAEAVFSDGIQGL